MAPSSFTGCCYCGNGIQYGVSHQFCTTCRLRFCDSCQSSHPSAHSYATYSVTALATLTDEYRPRVCSGCAKLTHSHMACSRNECNFVQCTDCFDNAMEEKVMHDHDELIMTSLPHRESLDRFDVGCKACREGKAFAHCTRCLEGIQPSSYFYSCMDCLRIYDDVTSTANLCETCMIAVRVTPQSLNHRFASFIFVISGDDENWSVSCSQCHMTLSNLESNVVSRHAHNSWTITMGLKFAENYPSLAVRTCARTSPGTTNTSQYQYNFPSPVPSPANQEVPHVASAMPALVQDPSRVTTSPDPLGSPPQQAHAHSREQSAAPSSQHSPSVAQTVTSGPTDMASSQMSQNFSRMSISHSQSPASPVGHQQQGTMPSIPNQTQMVTPTTTQSPQQMNYPQQGPAATAYPPNATNSPSKTRHGSMSYPAANQVMYQPNPTAPQVPTHSQQPQLPQLPQQPQQQNQPAMAQQQQQQQQHHTMRPMAMHANTAPAGSIQHMQMAPPQQQFIYTNAQGQILQAQPQPTQYIMTQQVINGQLVNVPVPAQNNMIMQAQPGMIPPGSTYPGGAQVIQAPSQQIAMVPVRRADGTTVLMPQSQIQVMGGASQAKPGVMTSAGAAGASTVAAGASRPAAAKPNAVAAQANAKSKAQNKFMQDLAKVAVGSLVKGVVSGAMN